MGEAATSELRGNFPPTLTLPRQGGGDFFQAGGRLVLIRKLFILARPRRTGARWNKTRAGYLRSFNPRPSAKDGRSTTLSVDPFQLNVSILARPRRTGARIPRRWPSAATLRFNPRPSAKDGRSSWTFATGCTSLVSILARPRRTGARGYRWPRARTSRFQSSPVREGRALHRRL